MQLASSVTSYRYRISLFINVLATLATCLYLFYIARFVLKTFGTDFLVYYEAAVSFHKGGNPYNVPAYVYGPLFIQLLQPLAQFSLTHARLIWFLFQIASLLALILLCIRESGSKYARQYWGVILLGVFIATPTYFDLVLGQVGSFMALLIVASYVFARRHSFFASLCLSFTIVIKLYPMLLWLAYLQARRWKSMLTVVICCFSLVLISLAIHGSKIYLDFAAKLIYHTDYPYAAEHNNSIIGFWLRLFTLNPFVRPLVASPVLVYTFISLSVLLILLFCWSVNQKPADKFGELLRFSAWLCAMSLVTPANGIYNLMVLLLPVLALIRYNELHRNRHLHRCLLIATILLYMPVMSSIYAIAELQAQRWVALYLTPSFYGVVLLFVLVIAVMHTIDSTSGGRKVM